MTQLKTLPIGIQDFEKVRKGEYLYIDKTELIYDMIKGGSYYSIFRPFLNLLGEPVGISDRLKILRILLLHKYVVYAQQRWYEKSDTNRTIAVE